jgi:hypothetical protein
MPPGIPPPIGAPPPLAIPEARPERALLYIGFIVGVPNLDSESVFSTDYWCVKVYTNNDIGCVVGYNPSVYQSVYPGFGCGEAGSNVLG